ncbi:MAG: hypothetical protein H0V76_04605 [Blastocatellia bacterium]|nr:hypothetical protein [Blastocatellia bacterium]
MGRISIQIITLFIILIAGYFGVYAISNFTANNRVRLPEAYSDSDLAFQGKRLKGWALGAEGLIADWYWMWSLQYVGNKIIGAGDADINLEDLTTLNPRLLYPFLDNATDLDPHFMPAYSYGASVLPAIDPELAISLTEKGIAANPEAWRLYQYLGYIHWRLEDYEKAAETYERGSTIPGAPVFMRQMVAAMQTEGGSRETARGIYNQLLAEAEDEQSRNNARLRLMELDSLDERDAIDKVLADVQSSTGRCPRSFREITQLLTRVKLPHNKDFRINPDLELVDPAGEPYRLDTETCTSQLSATTPIPKAPRNRNNQ